MDIYFHWYPILLATIAAFLLGALWFSPLLFLKLWLKGKGLTVETLPKRSKKYILTTAAYSLVAHGCIAAVLALILDITSVTTLPIALSLSLLMAFGFVVSTHFIDMIYTTEGSHYDKKHQISFLVISLYYIAVMALISVVLFYTACKL